MKPTIFSGRPLLMALLVAGLAIALLSWNSPKTGNRFIPQAVNDTVPKSKSIDKEKKIRNLDDVLDELNEADMKLDAHKMQEEINKAMKNFDAEKVRMQVEEAMKQVDMDKIQKEVEQSLDKIDMKKINAELADAMQEIDGAKIQERINESMKKIDWDKMKTEMNELKKIDMSKMDAELEKVQEKMKDLGPQLEKELEKAKGEIEKAKTEMKEYKGFVDGLESDGLINKKDGYTIKHEDGKLIINGKKVSDDVYGKYRPFLEKHKKFNIEKNDDDFNIDTDK